MKKKIVSLTLMFCLFSLTACSGKTMENDQLSAAQTEVASTEFASTVVVSDEVASDNSVITTLTGINEQVMAHVDAVKADAQNMELATATADAFSNIKNQYLNVMIACGNAEDMKALKKQIQKTFKALPLSVDEESISAFVEQLEKVTAEVEALKAEMDSVQ